MITIVYHKKNKDILLKNLRESEYKYICFDELIVLNSSNERIEFYTVEFLEQYNNSDIFMQTIYYPETEKDNKELMNTLSMSSRGVCVLLRGYLPCIIPYDEEQFFLNYLFW